MPPKKTNTSLVYVTVLVILFSLGVVFFLRSSAFAVERIEVQGLHIIPTSEILRLAEGIQGQNLLLFDQEGLSRRIHLHPLVEGVSFAKKLPHTLVIQVRERTPAALVLVPKGVLEVDAQGVFLRRLESWPPRDYPVITGINALDSVGPGQKISDPLLPPALKILGQAPSSLLPLIGEIHINPVQQITLFLTSGVEVRLGQAEEWKTKLEALYSLLSDQGYKDIEHGVRYIDFTAAKPVIGR